MRTYEIVTIFPLDKAAGMPDSGKTTLDGLLQKQGGKIVAITDMGKRALGYAVKKQKEGYCLVFDCQLEPSKVEPLKQALQLCEEIIKFTILVKVAPRVRPAKKVKAAAPAKTTPSTASHTRKG